MSFGKAGTKDVADAGTVIKYDPDSLFSVPVDSGANSWQALTVSSQTKLSQQTLPLLILMNYDTLSVPAQC